MNQWLHHHAWLIVLLSLLVFIAGVAAGFFFLIHMPADHFRPTHPGPSSTPKHPQWRHILLRGARNIGGILLILLGIVLSLPLVPGPGLVLLVVGLSLTDFPYKRKLELSILRRRWVFGPINRVRKWAGRAPLQLPRKQ